MDTSKPTATFVPTNGRKYTVSVAVPGSIIANAQTPDLQTKLAGQIARALAVFCVDEVVVFDDGQTPPTSSDRSQYTGFSDPNFFLTHILSYLECPPHLRRALFPMHPDLRLAGSLPSLDMPHHLKKEQWCRYREGITIQTQSDTSSERTQVNTGLDSEIFVHGNIPADHRVTVDFGEIGESQWRSGQALDAEAVTPSEPRERMGYFWGYSVRFAPTLSAVLTECPFDGGYDLTFGTSERGVPVLDLTSTTVPEDKALPPFTHMLIALGGVAGLEMAVRADKELLEAGVERPDTLFDYWVNLVPGQGSRTIRTEEAVWLALMGLKSVVEEKGME